MNFIFALAKVNYLNIIETIVKTATNFSNTKQNPLKYTYVLIRWIIEMSEVWGFLIHIVYVHMNISLQIAYCINCIVYSKELNCKPNASILLG